MIPAPPSKYEEELQELNDLLNSDSEDSDEPIGSKRQRENVNPIGSKKQKKESGEDTPNYDTLSPADQERKLEELKEELKKILIDIPKVLEEVDQEHEELYRKWALENHTNETSESLHM